MFSVSQRNGKELVEVFPGFAEALTFGLAGRSECMTWSVSHGNAVKTTKTNGKKIWIPEVSSKAEASSSR